MGVLDWLRRDRSGMSRSDEARAAESIERVIQLTNPRLRFARRYRARLMPAVHLAIDYARTLVADVPPARDASRAGWVADHAMRAFFAAPEEIGPAFSRSPELRAWFASNPGADAAHAVLSMQLVERRVLNVAVEGGILKRDVPQTTVSFSDHRARICAGSEPDLRQVIQWRIVDQLALLGIGLAAEDQGKRAVLEQERALLKMRVKLLEAQGAGLTALGARPPATGADLARSYADLAVNEANLKSIAAGPEALDYQLERLRDVLANPQVHFFVTKKHIRLDRMNILQREDDAAFEPLELQVARVPMPEGAPELRTFVLARFGRSDLLPPGALLADAARVLSLDR
ncbi:MAG TPA: hypothetical protein VHP37_33560 [Burkholderiales bacterium]|nr:hypothetical protein [Burkholderiales bacterium]